MITRKAIWLLPLLLTLILLLQWLGWSRESAVADYLQPRATTSGNPSAGITGGTLPPAGPEPVEAYSVVTERPLFIIGRRPIQKPEVVVEKAPPAKVDLVLELFGIVATAEGWHALIRSPEGESRKLAVGDEYQGWRVAEIEPDRVLFARDQRTEVFNLRTFPEQAPAAGKPVRKQK